MANVKFLFENTQLPAILKIDNGENISVTENIKVVSLSTGSHQLSLVTADGVTITRDIDITSSLEFTQGYFDIISVGDGKIFFNIVTKDPACAKVKFVKLDGTTKEIVNEGELADSYELDGLLYIEALATNGEVIDKLDMNFGINNTTITLHPTFIIKKSGDGTIINCGGLEPDTDYIIKYFRGNKGGEAKTNSSGSCSFSDAVYFDGTGYLIRKDIYESTEPKSKVSGGNTVISDELYAKIICRFGYDVDVANNFSYTRVNNSVVKNGKFQFWYLKADTVYSYKKGANGTLKTFTPGTDKWRSYVVEEYDGDVNDEYYLYLDGNLISKTYQMGRESYSVGIVFTVTQPIARACPECTEPEVVNRHYQFLETQGQSIIEGVEIQTDYILFDWADASIIKTINTADKCKIYLKEEASLQLGITYGMIKKDTYVYLSKKYSGDELLVAFIKKCEVRTIRKREVINNVNTLTIDGMLIERNNDNGELSVTFEKLEPNKPYKLNYLYREGDDREEKEIEITLSSLDDSYKLILSNENVTLRLFDDENWAVSYIAGYGDDYVISMSGGNYWAGSTGSRRVNVTTHTQRLPHIKARVETDGKAKLYWDDHQPYSWEWYIDDKLAESGRSDSYANISNYNAHLDGYEVKYLKLKHRTGKWMKVFEIMAPWEGLN